MCICAPSLTGTCVITQVLRSILQIQLLKRGNLLLCSQVVMTRETIALVAYVSYNRSLLVATC
jgi:hypothetical protein